jgi:DNA-binding SARP family transcriptional activator
VTGLEPAVTEQLSFKFLGPPVVSYQGQSLQFRSRKVLALLIYLVVEGGWHSRDSLMTLLWPDSDQQRASMSLRSTIARLRRTLAVAGEFIITQPGQVGFDFQQPFELDLRLVEAARHPDAPSQAWQAALAADRGAFLAGLFLADAPDFEQWATVQREIWQRHLETVYERLARWQLVAADYKQALATATQWTLCAPLSEAAYRHLMEAHFLAGDRPAALHVYQRCVRMLDDELGVAPAAETVALAERIRTISPLRPLPEVRAQPSPLAELPLVGRAAEHSQLASLYQQAGQDTTQVVIVIGEAGMGKTRLAQAFVRWASLETPGADVLQGRPLKSAGGCPTSRWWKRCVRASKLKMRPKTCWPTSGWPS